MARNFVHDLFQRDDVETEEVRYYDRVDFQIIFDVLLQHSVFVVLLKLREFVLFVLFTTNLFLVFLNQYTLGEKHLLE